MLKKGLPHALLFTGPSGCGKTTLARVLKNKLRCSDHDFKEMNCADFRGIDMVRDIRASVNLAPMNGECRIWLIDECHELTKNAQNAFLKLLEDTPRHVYFFLATTDPGKLLKTIITRCSQIKVALVPDRELSKHLETIIKAETKTVPGDVLEKIVETAEGSVRKALVLLDQVIGMDNEKEQLSVIQRAEAEREGIAVARALMNPRIRWPEMAKVLKETTEEPETIRWIVLGYMRSVLLGGGKLAPRAAGIIEEFSEPFYNSKAAGLTFACYSIICGGD